LDLLRAVNRTHGQTIVLVTHAQEIGAQVDRVIHMHDGRVME
jgi:ABC-type lipoprotein export system ATPase subunit